MNRITTLLILALLAFSCSDSKGNNDTNEKLNALRVELDSLKNSNKTTTLPLMFFVFMVISYYAFK